MSGPSSPRVSSRLACKKQCRNWKDDIFEYTPLTPCHKKTEKSSPEEGQQAPKKAAGEPSHQRKRGRPPKAKTLQALASKCKPEDHENKTPPLVASTSPNDMKQKPRNQENSFANKMHEDVYWLVQGLMEQGCVHHSGEEELYSVVAACLPKARTRNVPVDTLQELAKDSGIVIIRCSSGDNLVFGSLEKLAEAKQKLLELIKENRVENGSSAMGRDNKDHSSLSSERDFKNENSKSSEEEGKAIRADDVLVITPVSDDQPTEGTAAAITTSVTDHNLSVNQEHFGGGEKGADSVSETSMASSSLIDNIRSHVKSYLNSAGDGIKLNESQSELDRSGYEGTTVTDTNQTISYVSNRQGPKRRQGKCKHMKESCDICTSHCKLCQYRSTEIAVKKHMQRVHPTTTYDCEVCGMQFGIRYDMRRHRMLHFDDDGLLNSDARTYLRQNDKSELLSLSLADLEVNFIAKTPDRAEKPEDCKDGESSIKTEITTDKALNTGGFTLLQAVKADPDEGEVLCGFCDYAGFLDSVLLHHRSRHRVPDAANLEHICPVCGLACSPDEFKHHYFEICAKESGTEKDHANITANCKLCQLNGPLKIIKTHIEDHPEKLLCSVCRYVGSADDMVAHIKRCRRTLKRGRKSQLRNPPKESLVLYKCGICSNIFKTRASLQMHFKSHEVDKIYKCEGCDFQTTRAGLLNAHMRKKHASVEQRKCNICSKVFNQVASLRFHKESVHGIGRTLHRCQHCTKVFSTKRFLQVHIKRVHFAVKSYFCSVCKKGFFERARMLDHENIHLLPSERAKKKHVCSFCGKAYSQKSILRQHENTHQGLRPYKCNQCDKSFAFTAQLHKHRVAHRTERPHVCVHCGKGFKFPYKLTAHLVTHTKQGRHSCLACNKVYTSRSSLHKHMYHACPVPRNRLASHQFCTTCNRMFTTASELRKHQCQAVDSEEVFVTSEGHTDTQELIAQRAAEESVVSSNGVLQILGAEGESQMVATDSEVIMLTGDAMQDIVTATEPLEGNKLDVENIKSVFVGEDLDQSSILYMCCVCNKLFSEQSQVNTHMELEHEAEAIIGPSVSSETTQVDISPDNLANLYTVTSDNSIIVRATSDDSCLTTDAVSVGCNVISGIETSIVNLSSTVTMVTSQPSLNSPS